MQSGLLNLLLGIPAGSTSGTSAFDTNGGGIASDLFSQLLGDAGAQTGQDGAGGASGLLASELTPSALVAQEVSANVTMTPAMLTQLLGQEISPQEAAALAAKIDLISNQSGAQQGGAGQQDVWQQLKSALLQTANGSTPQKLSDILQALPAVQDSAEHIPASGTQTDANASNNPSGLMQSMLAFLQMALDKTKEVRSQQQDIAAETSQIVTPVTTSLNLQAAGFRSGDDVDEASAQTPQHEKDRTVVEIVPLAMQGQMIVPQWVQQMNAGQSNADLDEAIPPLALKGNDALPVVALPVSQTDAADENPLTTGPLTASATPPAWLEHLPFPLALQQAHTDTQEVQQVSEQTVQGDAAAPAAMADQATQAAMNGALAKPNAKNAALVKAADDATDTAPSADGSGSVSANNANALAVNNAQAAQANRTTHTQATAYAAGPHASPVEQVHVAIRQAAGDGIDHITIQLEPAELGRVVVSMNTGSDGRTHMNFLADKASTLDALSRGAVNLERSLQDAGIKADAGSMQFNLRQQPQPQLMGNGLGQGSGQSSQSKQAYPEQSDNTGIAPIDGSAPIVTRHYTVNVNGGVDIHA